MTLEAATGQTNCDSESFRGKKQKQKSMQSTACSNSTLSLCTRRCVTSTAPGTELRDWGGGFEFNVVEMLTFKCVVLYVIVETAAVSS